MALQGILNQHGLLEPTSDTTASLWNKKRARVNGYDQQNYIEEASIREKKINYIVISSTGTR